MALLSKVLNEFLLPETYNSEISNCCACGQHTSKGGMWLMHDHHLGICEKCAPILLDWYIDSLLDTGVIQENNDAANMQKLSNDIIERYRRKKEIKEKHNKSHM